MISFKKILLTTLLLTIFPLPFSAFSQTITDSYEKLWSIVRSDTLSKKKKLHYLEIYYRKAKIEKDRLEEYRALEKKAYLVTYNDAVVLLKKMQPIVSELNNDSLAGDFLNLNTVFHYEHRNYNKALDYAIQSESFNEKNNNLYSLNFVRITIGNIYYHTRNYEKALIYFSQAKEYYKTVKDENHKRSYVIALYSLGKTYWQLEDVQQLKATISESEDAIKLLRPNHQKFETAYLDYVKGGLAFLENDYTTAKNYFETALPIIKQNDDFTNEHVIYLYLGKIARMQNQKATAVTYFNKIDQLFQEKKFLNYELRETYEYLITYYKETQQLQLQLQATESLIALNRQFEKEQHNITKTLHKELDTKKLEKEREQLHKQLKRSKKTYGFWLSLLGAGLLGLTAYSIWQDREKKKFKTKFEGLLQKIQNDKQNHIVLNTALDAPIALKSIKVSIPEEGISHKPEIDSKNDALSYDEKSAAVKATEKRLSKELERFEKEKRFLTTIKLDDLAKEFGTNRNTLSAIINEYKGSYNTYINKLRINQLLVDLTNQPEIRKFNISEIAEMYGFANAKTLTNQFKAETELTPSYFIKELELRDLKNKK